MKTLKNLFLLALLTFFLVVAIPIDGIMFALVNSCTSCSTFAQYLQSNVSLFSATLASISGLLVYFKQKK